MKRLYASAVVVLMLFGAVSAYAKSSVDKVTLAGPHWYGEVEITDPQLLEYLSLGAFFDVERPLEQPPLVSTGYLMTSYVADEGEFAPVDRQMYFPGEQPGEGVVYYIEMVDALGPYDGRWYPVKAESEAALLCWLSEEGILPTSIEFESPQINSPGTNQALLVGGGMLLVGLLAGVAMGRRQP